MTAIEVREFYKDGAPGETPWQLCLAASVSALLARFARCDAVMLRIGGDDLQLSISNGTTIQQLISQIAGSDLNLTGSSLNAVYTPAGGWFQHRSITVLATESGRTIEIQLTTNNELPCPVLERSLLTLITCNRTDDEVQWLCVLHQQDRHNALAVWGDTAWDSVELAPIHRMFESQASRTPDAVALVDGEDTWTYSELNSVANRLASALREEGVTAGMPIGIYTPRSAQTIIAMYGVLKCGGVFIFLDTNLPIARLEKISELAAPYMILHSESCQNALQEFAPGSRKRCIEQAVETGVDDVNSIAERALSDPAYIVFTSGSTGEPKGVIGLHQGISNRTYWELETYPLSDGDVYCQKASLSFIDAIGEITSPAVVRASFGDYSG